MKKLLRTLQVKWSWFKYHMRKDKNQDIKYDLTYHLNKIYGENLSNLGIHNVKVKRGFYQIYITIYLEHPGILIGKAGSKIKELTLKMEIATKRNVSIVVKEFSPLPSVYCGPIDFELENECQDDYSPQFPEPLNFLEEN